MLSRDDCDKIRDLLNAYHYFVDEPGFPRLREIFTEDAVLDSTDYGGTLRRGWTEIAQQFEKPSGVLCHTCTNIVIRDEADGVHCVSKVVALIPDGKVGMAIHTDRVRLTPEGWRIAKRVISRPPPLKA